MNKTEIERVEDVFSYLNEHFHYSVKAKKNRGRKKEKVQFDQLFKLNEILEKGFNIDLYFFFDSNSRPPRRRDVVYLRFICFNFLKKEYNLKTIATMLNRYDHSTVIHGLKQYEQLRNYPDFLFKPFNDQFNRVRDELGY